MMLRMSFSFLNETSIASLNSCCFLLNSSRFSSVILAIIFLRIFAALKRHVQATPLKWGLPKAYVQSPARAPARQPEIPVWKYCSPPHPSVSLFEYRHKPQYLQDG